MDLTEAEDIKKRWQEYTEELYKKDLHNPDNQDGVITHIHLERDILKCEVKWALRSITMNKASGGDAIPTELFQSLKDDAVKVLHSICHQIWKTQQWPQDWKSQFLFQSQRKAMPKNAQTTTQLHSSPFPIWNQSVVLLAILIPACVSSNPAFLMMYSACKLNGVTIYSLDELLFLFGTSLLLHVQF